jgi:integrase
MASLFRPTISRYTLPNGSARTPDGQRVNKDTPGARRKKSKAKKWYGQYKDADGIEHRDPLSANKTVAQQMLNEVVRKAELGKVGIVDRFADHRKTPLAEHLADYHAAMLNEGTSAKQAGQVQSRCRKILEGCGFVFMADLSASRVQAFVAGLRRADKPPPLLNPAKQDYTKAELCAALGIKAPVVTALVRRHGLVADGNGKARRFPKATAEALRDLLSRGRGVQTVNFYLAAVKQFCNWLVKDRRMPDNPLAHLSGGNVQTDRRHDRRPLSEDELRLLLATTKASEWTAPELSGYDRHMLYVVACVTGFRKAELATLTPKSFDLDAEPPTATVPAAYTKNKKLAEQPLPPDVVAAFREYLDGKPAGVPLWPGTWTERAAEMFRRDLEAAGIPYAVEGPDGPLFADFHALRHSYVALLDKAGVSLKQAMQLARHSDPRLTMARYGRAQLADLGATVERLPSLTTPSPRTEIGTLRATGTDSDPARRCTARCTNVAEMVDTGCDGLTFIDATEGEQGNANNPTILGVLRQSEAERDRLNQVHLAGLEPATFGSVDRCSIQLSYRCKGLISKDLLTSRAGRVIYG